MVVVGTALAVSLLLPKQYTAETALVVDAKSADPLMGGMLPAQMIPGYMATQVDIINSTRASPCGWSTCSRWTSRRSSRSSGKKHTEGQGSIKIWLAELLMKKLDVQPSRESSMLTIGYQGADPQFAAAVANAWAQAYIDTSLELKVEPARQYAKWFDGQNATLRADLEAAQKRLSDYQQSRASSPPTTGSTLKTPASPSSRPSSRWLRRRRWTAARARRNPATPTTCPRSRRTASSRASRPISCARKASATSSPAASARTTLRSPAAMPKSPTCASASPPKRAAW